MREISPFRDRLSDWALAALVMPAALSIIGCRQADHAPSTPPSVNWPSQQDKTNLLLRISRLAPTPDAALAASCSPEVPFSLGITETNLTTCAEVVASSGTRRLLTVVSFKSNGNVLGQLHYTRPHNPQLKPKLLHALTRDQIEYRKWLKEYGLVQEVKSIVNCTNQSPKNIEIINGFMDEYYGKKIRSDRGLQYERRIKSLLGISDSSNLEFNWTYDTVRDHSVRIDIIYVIPKQPGERGQIARHNLARVKYFEPRFGFTRAPLAELNLHLLDEIGDYHTNSAPFNVVGKSP